jgi:flagellar protein FliO/FliZ
MSNSPDMLTSTLKMMLSLGVVLVVLISFFYGLKRFMQRGPAGSRDKLITILASQYIGVKKSISIVQVPGAVLVLGVTSDRIHLLHQITDNQIVDSVLAVRQTTGGSLFSEHLSKMTAMLSGKGGRNG